MFFIRYYLYIIGLVQLIGLTVFSIGFFPYKTYLPGFSTVNDGLTEPEFDRLVFVVVDALRNDFIFQDTGFQFVKSLIDKGTAIPFTAKATAPTVTMPRIKAMTTGTVPSFLDAILNIAESDTSSSLEYQDNWVYQFKNTGNRTIHFFGDDTWIRLLPGMFTKTDGTISFYVSDTVEVDHNVTRHIKPVLQESDWDAVILHYLGLDHVGHLGGPKSPLMHPKQQEMDKVIETIYTMIVDQDAKRSQLDVNAKGTLIVLCGDHGMNEAGNHGGSSIGETSAAMVFISPKYDQRSSVKHETSITHEYDSPPIIPHDQTHTKTPLRLYKEFTFGYPVIDQIDLVPTLSILFGFPIPKNNLGKVILDLYGGNNKAPSLLRSDQATKVLRALELNAQQLGKLMGNQVCPTGSTRHQDYLRAPSQSLALDAATAYLECIDEFKYALSSTASDYNLIYMSIGCGLMLVSAVITCTSGIKLVLRSSQWRMLGGTMVFFILGHAISVFASSFVEEEQYIWYYYLQSFLLVLALQSLFVTSKWKQLVLLVVSQMILVRCGMLWRQNDLGSKLLLMDDLMWYMFTISLFLPVLCGLKVLVGMKQTNTAIDVSQSAAFIRKMCKLAYGVATLLTATLVLAYKLRDSTSLFGADFYQSFELVKQLNQVELGQLIYNYAGTCFLLLTAILYVSKHANYMNLGQHEDYERPYLRLLLYMMTPLLILLSKPHDSILYLLFTLQFECLLIYQRTHGGIPIWVRSFTVICYCQFGFFVMGRTNSIASIDLSNAYIGVDGYQTTLIGLTTFCSNWSGSLWWCVAGWVLAFDDDNYNGGWFDYCLIQHMMFGVTVAALSLSVTILREHLFIWTVFSPKYLYQIAWTVLYFGLVQMVCGTVMTSYWYRWSAPHQINNNNEEQDDQADSNLDD
ncbi:hypothetical protein BC941DRAFT_477199 [Chlamydoabsidia padenii]|nr:hypothetical protein BC941DRAFT_477199 [Chlamydoabsidia padenii]